MSYTMKPLGCDPARIKGMSERSIISHYLHGGDQLACGATRL
jgi:hypothetical protein